MDQPNAHIAVPQRFAEPLDLDAVFASEPRRGRPRINAVCEDLFDGQLDVERAYWLGFIYADGSVAYKPYWAVTVTLAAKDEGHVLALCHLLGGRVARTKSGAVRLLAHSKALCRSLATHGVVPRKSYEPVAPPTLTGDLHRAFLRGLFDGNACLHITRRGHFQAAFCGHPAIVTWFCEQVGIETNGAPRIRGGAAYAQWTSSARATALAAFLYGGSGPHLERKARIAAEMQS